jgi:hypothetical protein
MKMWGSIGGVPVLYSQEKKQLIVVILYNVVCTCKRDVIIQYLLSHMQRMTIIKYSC